MNSDNTNPDPSPIFIVGYMACGKTTFGRALAKALDREFIDLDFRIEQRFRSSISDIFATRGEEAFRRIEASMLREVADMENVVVACGGGTPCFHSNMDVILERGLTVWLQATPQRTVERLIRNRRRRPLMADKSEEELLQAVTDGLQQRNAFYSQAHIIFPGDELEDRRQIDSSIAGFLRIPQIRDRFNGQEN